MWARLNPVLSKTSGKRKIRRPEEQALSELGLLINDCGIVDYLGTLRWFVDWRGHSIRHHQGSHFNHDSFYCNWDFGFFSFEPSSALLASANMSLRLLEPKPRIGCSDSSP